LTTLDLTGTVSLSLSLSISLSPCLPSTNTTGSHRVRGV
jgi:hypothetical protein